MDNFDYTQTIEYHMSNKGEGVFFCTRDEERLIEGAYSRPLNIDESKLGKPVSEKYKFYL
jgi:hypothetical protein